MAIRNSRELVIRASKGPQAGVYFVGPYGARVSFASQQRRALNLVWALRETEGEWPEEPQPRVAVVGAGIAGLTIAAALRMQGCSVWLYDSAGSELSIQARATHRYVHPSINFWPEQELSWTTRLPFLDWFASSCDDIVRTLGRQWEAQFAGKIARFERGWTFRGFSKGRGANAEMVRLRFKDRPDRFAHMLFITTGYGPERDLRDPRYRSYWEPDRIDAMSLEAGKRFAVSGTGDGGLIDALRLAYPGFMSAEIALRYLAIVDSEGLRERVRKVEARAETMEAGARAEFYHRRYTEIAADQDSAAQSLLHPLLPGKNPIELIGRGTHPYDIGAAPIHKLLLAHSIEHGRIVFSRGDVTRRRGRYWITPPGGAIQRLDRDLVLVRHGAVPPVKNFVSEAQRQELEDLQRQLGDWLDIGDYDSVDYFNAPKLAPGRNRDFGAFVESRAELAQQFLRRRFGVAMRTPLDGAVPGFEVVDDRPAGAGDGPFGPLPQEVFGIRLAKAGARSGAIHDLTGRY